MIRGIKIGGAVLLLLILCMAIPGFGSFIGLMLLSLFTGTLGIVIGILSFATLFVAAPGLVRNWKLARKLGLKGFDCIRFSWLRTFRDTFQKRYQRRIKGSGEDAMLTGLQRLMLRRHDGYITKEQYTAETAKLRKASKVLRDKRTATTQPQAPARPAVAPTLAREENTEDTSTQTRVEAPPAPSTAAPQMPHQRPAPQAPAPQPVEQAPNTESAPTEAPASQEAPAQPPINRTSIVLPTFGGASFRVTPRRPNDQDK